MPTLTIIRGLPGSGKSTLAQKMGCFHIESDMFAICDGVYKYNRNRAKKVPAWILDIAKRVLYRKSDVAVAGVFAHRKSIRRFETLANEVSALNGIPVKFRVIHCIGSHKSVHNVPKAAIDGMKADFEEWKGEEIHE